jgi:hypothetical protein
MLQSFSTFLEAQPTIACGLCPGSHKVSPKTPPGEHFCRHFSVLGCVGSLILNLFCFDRPDLLPMIVSLGKDHCQACRNAQIKCGNIIGVQPPKNCNSDILQASRLLAGRRDCSKRSAEIE